MPGTEKRLYLNQLLQKGNLEEQESLFEELEECLESWKNEERATIEYHDMAKRYWQVFLTKLWYWPYEKQKEELKKVLSLVPQKIINENKKEEIQFFVEAMGEEIQKIWEEKESPSFTKGYIPKKREKYPSITFF